MKKVNLLMGVVTAVAVTACTNDNLGDTTQVVDDTLRSPIGFNFRTTNMNRVTGLEEEHVYDFGVWAYKAGASTDTQADAEVNVKSMTGEQGADIVMYDYLVGYWNGTKGYDPAPYYQNDHGTGIGFNWYYEGLGKEEKHYTYKPFASETDAESHRDNQYLKYWDLDKKYTFFYACAPYGAATFDAANLKLTFGTLTSGVAPMYACAIAENSTKTADLEAYQVNLAFKRLGSQIRISFHNSIPGYDVEVLDFNATNAGVYFVPAQSDGNTPATYSAGSYTGNVKSVDITFAAGVATPSYTYDTSKTSTDNISWTRNGFTTWDNVNSVLPVPSTPADKTYSASYAVVPDGDNSNTGFTLNVSFKLTAQDTKEVIYVHGARAFVPADECHWAINTRYTYNFNITRNVTGSTTGTPVLSVTPDAKALYPIIFEDVTVDGYTDVNYDHDLN